MSSLFRVGQTLKGRIGTYTITRQVQEALWFAKNSPENVVIKVLANARVENERNILRRFQHRSPYLRPMIDEIEELPGPTIALKHLKSDLLETSIKKSLNRQELKYVTRRILEALKILHEDAYVHTDVKINNVLVTFKDGGDVQFSDVQLGGLGGCYPANSELATSGAMVGTPIISSPEVLFEMPWNTATDIWSFGALLINLTYGNNFNLFLP